MLTEEILKNSKEFKDWVTGRIALIHNVYHDSPVTTYKTFIVLHSDMGKWTITRFFTIGSKLNVSEDHKDISTEEAFKILLTEYSRGLE